MGCYTHSKIYIEYTCNEFIEIEYYSPDRALSLANLEKKIRFNSINLESALFELDGKSNDSELSPPLTHELNYISGAIEIIPAQPTKLFAYIIKNNIYIWYMAMKYINKSKTTKTYKRVCSKKRKCSRFNRCRKTRFNKCRKTMRGG